MMDHESVNKNLKKLPVNKTVVFSSPVEGSDVLVRTGTISENAFFLHAFLNGYSKDYISMNKGERIQFTRRLKASLLGRVDIDSWEELGQGTLSKMSFFDNVSTTFNRFEEFLKGSDRIKGKATRRLIKKSIEKEQDLEIYQIVFAFLPINVIINKIIPEVQVSTEKIKGVIDTLVKSCVTYLAKNESFRKIDSKKQELIVTSLNFLLRFLCKDAYNTAYRDYVKNLKDMEDEVDGITVKSICDKFNRDIYFIDPNVHLPYHPFPDEDLYKCRKSIILLKMGPKHYEIIGRLLPGNRIQREFDFKDHLISKFNLYITNQDEFQKQYPEFSNDNTEKHRDSEDDKSNKDSESESESDRYYDESSKDSDDSDEEEENSTDNEVNES